MRKTRTEFSDRIKAEIFARDRATCSFTGCCLWILDHGAAWHSIIDWVDHTQPASNRGASTPENGVCASWKANQRKNNNGKDREYWFFHGRPTWHFFYENTILPSSLAERLKRHSKLQPSDWYFNRALHRLFEGLNDEGHTRNSAYWFKSSAKALQQWRKAIEFDADTRSMEKRLILKLPLTADMKILLRLREAETVKDVARIADIITPLYRAHNDIYWSFLESKTSETRRRWIAKARKSKNFSPVVLRLMRDNLKALETCGGCETDI